MLWTAYVHFFARARYEELTREPVRRLGLHQVHRLVQHFVLHGRGSRYRNSNRETRIQIGGVAECVV